MSLIPELYHHPPKKRARKQNSHCQAGYRIGLVVGSIFGPTQGANARFSGLAADPMNIYQPPTQEEVCLVYQDFVGTVSQNAIASTCDQRQQQVKDFFEGYTNGHANGFGFGFLTGYILDEIFLPQCQQPGQSQTQPPVTSEGLFGPGGPTPPPPPEGTP